MGGVWDTSDVFYCTPRFPEARIRDMFLLRKIGRGAPINASGRPQPTPNTLSPWLPGAA